MSNDDIIAGAQSYESFSYARAFNESQNEQQTKRHASVREQMFVDDDESKIKEIISKIVVSAVVGA